MDNEVKEFLLKWLIEHGRNNVRRKDMWNKFGVDEWELSQVCTRIGYLDSKQEPKTFNYYHALSDKGLEFLNKGEKHE